MTAATPFTACQHGNDAEWHPRPCRNRKLQREASYGRLRGPAERGERADADREPAHHGLLRGDRAVDTARRQDRAARRPVRPTRPTDRWSTQGLEIAVEEPTRTWTVNYRNTVALISTPSLLAERGRQALKNSPSLECEISLKFEASVPMFTIAEDGDCTPGSSQIATDHYEQFGHVTGSVRVGSTTWHIEKATPRSATTPGVRGSGPPTTASGWRPGWPTARRSPPTVRSSPTVNGHPAAWWSPRTACSIRSGTTRSTPTTPVSRRTTAATPVSSPADGLPLMVLDGSINHFVPVTQRIGPTAPRAWVRMSVRYANGQGGWGTDAEFLRPIKERCIPDITFRRILTAPR